MATSDQKLRYYTGDEYSADELLNLVRGLGSITDPKNLQGGVYGTKLQSVGFDPAELRKVLGRDPTVQEQVMFDAAAGLRKKGVTDVSQIQSEKVSGTGQLFDDEYGQTYVRYSLPWEQESRTRLATPEEIARAKLVQGSQEGENQRLLENFDLGYGVKDKGPFGATLQNYYGAGSTATGDGMTQYGIYFDENGKPQFRTYGISSSDLPALEPVLFGAALAAPFLFGGIGSLASEAMGPLTAEQLGTSFAADMAAAGYPGVGIGALESSGGIGPVAGEGGGGSYLTPAAIESGLGTPGYGYSAAAAESGLFDPSMIGAGAGTSFAGLNAPSMDAMAADNIDVGGGYNPATGAGDAATAAGAAATGVTSSAGIPKAAAGVSGVGAAKDVASKIKDALGGKDSGILGTGLSGAGLLAGIGGLAGLIKLIQEDNKRYGVPGRQDTFNPLAGYKFSPSTYQPTIANPAMFKPQGMAAGGMAGYAMGGASDLGSYSDGGRMLKGPGDGMSDSIPGEIGGQRPARLADGEFVVPADVVSGLGNGSTDAGARQLYKMMDRVRTARTGTKKQGREINPQRHMPV